MIVRCAYCDTAFNEFMAYKFHIKVYHNKKTYNDKLICGQNGCPLDFNKFHSLCQHIKKSHKLPPTCHANLPSNKRTRDCCEEVMDCDDVEPVTEPSPTFSPGEMFEKSLDENGILHGAALFIAKLRSNPKIPLGVVNDIVQRCTDFLTPAVLAVKHEVQSILHDNSVPDSKMLFSGHMVYTTSSGK